MTNPPPGRRAVHIMDGDTLLHSNVPLPTLSRDELAALTRYLEEVWALPAEWHPFLHDDLSLRVVPIESSRGDICFDIRDAGQLSDTCRYRYERVRGIIIVRGDHSFEYDSEQSTKNIAQRFAECCLKIVAALEQRLENQDIYQRKDRTGTLYSNSAIRFTTLGGLIHRIVDHWFAPRAKTWSWWKRCLFTFSGGITFFVFWSAYIVGATEGFASSDIELVSLTFLGVSAIGSCWFASLTAWKDLSYGPVRLFLSGFMLPYFVWTLIAIMYERPFPDLTNSRATAVEIGPPVPLPPRSQLE